MQSTAARMHSACQPDPKPFSSDEDSTDLSDEEEAESELAAVLAGPTSESTGAAERAEAGDAAPSTVPSTASGAAPGTASSSSSSSTTSSGTTSTTRGQGAARALVLPRTPTRRNSTASARGASSEMRRATPQNKAVEKSTSPRVTLRLHHVKTRDDRKGAAKPAERESNSNTRALSGNMEGKGSGDDVYEFKSSKEATPVRGASASPEPPTKMSESTSSSDSKERESKADAPTEPTHTGAKRNATEMVDGDEGDEESRRKKRKETESSSKDNPRSSAPGRAANGRNGGANNDKTKPTASKSATNPVGKPAANVEKNPELKSGTSSGSNSPKPSSAAATSSTLTSSKVVEADAEDSQGKTGDAVGPKVPPLKIVIPQQSATLEPEPGTRVGKNGNSRHHQALPYVVASSNSNDSVPDKEGGGSGSASPTDALDKKDSNLTEDQRTALHHQRVLRSSNRSGNGGPNPSGSRSSSPTAGSGGGEETSPQQSRQQSPAPSEAAASVVPETTSAPSPGKTTTTTTVAPISAPVDEKPGPTETNPITSQPTPAPPPQTVSMELHPRKRKLKPHREQPPAPTPSAVNTESTEAPYTTTEVHPHEQPITNCYQLFLNIRKQIERRRKNLFPVQPKPPQGFKDYLMNRCTYVLASNASTRIAAPNSPPASLVGGLKELFVDQEKERQKLKMQHIIEKEKLVLSVEQEILRVHGRAARALANQALPFSACSILKDEEVYNVITPEQEEKDRNARSRYNGRLFLSWLQDVDDKWEKIKESMLLRHHNEAESLHAVQRMDWDWKVKEMGPCEECPPPMVHVSDDFDLLPA
ncbi:ankyrin repeat domain-containing protein 11 isoform X2 [Thrips palmi]|uniref:Ankyrin repeat domain-containing protein 11 isoform X2 n=1 Tax=Thrips palmi TaxID=161013 RepID=A0A6P8Y7Q4_THRPL|nr:ankyrin repeat domain-containing protein 11 isoform X2 [Thrips palmi]